MAKKCMATGKVIFSTYVEARYVMFNLKWSHKRRKDIFGKRIKRRQGKPVQKRVYSCPHCDGYHLTKWKTKDYSSYIENLDQQ